MPAATLQLACALAPRGEARARRLSRPKVGCLRAESSRRADDADAQLKLATGQPEGQPHPTYFARGAPARALPAQGRTATSPRPSQQQRGRGAHMYRGNYSYSNAALRRVWGQLSGPQRIEELPDRAKYQRRVTPSPRGRTYRENRQPQRRAWQ